MMLGALAASFDLACGGSAPHLAGGSHASADAAGAAPPEAPTPATPAAPTEPSAAVTQVDPKGPLPSELPRYDKARFEPVLTYPELAPQEECLHIFPGFVEIAATSRGVWVLGACGVRARYMDGKLERFATKVEQRTVMPGASCTAHRMHWSISASSDAEAFLLGSPRCGPDPSAVWQNELERFDGTRWTHARATFGAGNPHESDAFRLATKDGALYAVVSGDSWHGPPDNALVRVTGTRVEELRSGLGAANRALLDAAHRDPVKHHAAIPNAMPYEDYEHLVASKADELWVAGALREYVQQNADGHGEPEKHVAGAVWHLAAGQWSEHRIDDEHLRAIAVAPDGTVFVGGDGLWRMQSGATSFERLSSGWAIAELGYGVGSIVALGAGDMWAALGCGAADCAGPVVVHYGGGVLRRVEVAFPDGAPEAGRLSRDPRIDAKPGGPIWLLGEQVLWKLVTTSTR